MRESTIHLSGMYAKRQVGLGTHNPMAGGSPLWEVGSARCGALSCAPALRPHRKERGKEANQWDEAKREKQGLPSRVAKGKITTDVSALGKTGKAHAR